MKTNYTIINKKRHRKINQGECFTYQFENGDIFLGVVLYAELDVEKWGKWFKKTSIVLLLAYTT